MLAYAVPLSQCLLVSMGDIETTTNTKTTLSNMSRWKPSHAGAWSSAAYEVADVYE